MKLLVTGTSGQLAQSLLATGLAAGVDVAALRRPQLDLTIPGTIRAALIDVQPDVVVSAAAYTAVDKAESEPDVAMAVNGAGAGELARHCARFEIPIIHLSTDYVFDGTKSQPYLESDPVAPLNAYGRSKLDGERQVAAATPRHVILRTAWVHSPFGTNFVKTMLRLAETRRQIAVVDDQWGCPTYAPHLAEAILSVARTILLRPDDPELWGTFNATGSGETTWCGFAQEIFRCAAGRGISPPAINAIPTSAYPTPARRPTNSRLDCTRLATVYGIGLPPWQHGAADCIDRLLPSKS